MVLVYPVAFWNPVNQGGASDPHFNNRLLLLKGEDPTQIIDSSSFSRVPTSNTNVATSTVWKQFGDRSILFNGTDSRLLYNSFAALTAGNFTVEAFINPTNISQLRILIAQDDGGSDGQNFQFRITTSGRIQFLYWANSSRSSAVVVESSNSVVLNASNYIAAVRNGNNLSLWINGVQEANHSITSMFGALLSIAIGQYTVAQPVGTYYAGYIDELRISNRAENVSVIPTSPFPDSGSSDPFANNVVLFLKGEGTNGSTNIIDSSLSPKIIDRFGNTQISTAQSKYNGSSIFFDGSGDYLTSPHNNDFRFGVGDFTIELWFYPLAYKSEDPFVTKYNASGGSPSNQFFLGQFSGAINFGGSFTGSDYTQLVAAPNPALNQWHHIAVCRNSNTFRMFLNGNLTESTNNSGTLFGNETEVLGIGYRRDNGITTQNNISLYFSHIRLTKGVGRYTSNFNPETDTFLNV